MRSINLAKFNQPSFKRILITSSIITGAFTLMPQDAQAKRILFASQFSLIPESEAHREFGSEATETALDPNSIKIMVWNIKKGQEKGLDRDLPYYAQNKDLMIISEGYLSSKVKPIFESIPLKWHMGVAFLYKKDHNYETGTMIGSKVEPSWLKIKHTKDYEPFIKTPKALTMGKYPIKGTDQELLVISVHAINMVVPAAFKRHMNLAKDEIIKHNGPVIFAGDFNTNLGSKAKWLIKMISDLGFQTLSFRNDQRNKVLGNPIDYVFVKGLHAKDAEVLGHLKSSDHKAMLAELVLNQ